MAGCQSNVPDFVVVDCVQELGRVVGLAFIHKTIHAGIYADPSNAALWVDSNYASDLHVFQEVRGTYNGGEPTEINGFGSQGARAINGDHILTVQIEGVKNNENFWNEISKSNDYRVAWVVGGNYDVLKINNKDCMIYATDPIEEGLDSEYVWNVTIKWRDFNKAKSSDVPAGIFQ